MSNQDKFNAVDQAALEKMSTQELNDLLKKTFELSDLSDEDINLILMITEVLKIRDRNDDYIPVDVDAAWEDFKKEYLPLAEKGTSVYDFEDEDNETDIENDSIPASTPKKKRRSFKRIAGIAAALAIVLVAVGGLIPRADGSNLWSTIVTWTQDTFGIGPKSQTFREEYPQELGELKDLLGNNGFSASGLLPKHIPEGYESIESVYIGQEDSGCYICQLKKDSSLILLNYRILSDGVSESEFQKNGEDPEQISINEHSFFVIQNMDLFSAYWIEGNVECSIQNVPSHDELLTIINSIYEE